MELDSNIFVANSRLLALLVIGRKKSFRLVGCCAFADGIARFSIILANTGNDWEREVNSFN